MLGRSGLTVTVKQSRIPKFAFITARVALVAVAVSAKTGALPTRLRSSPIFPKRL